MDGAAIVWYYIVGMFAAMTVALVADAVSERQDKARDASGADGHVHEDATQVTPWTPMAGGA